MIDSLRTKLNRTTFSIDENTKKLIFEPYLTVAPYHVVSAENLSVDILDTNANFCPQFLPNEKLGATIIGTDVLWNRFTGVKQLVLKLESQELQDFRKDVVAQYIKSGFALDAEKEILLEQVYNPKIYLCYDISNSNFRNRWWTNQVLNDFNEKWVNTFIMLENPKCVELLTPALYNPNVEIQSDYERVRPI